MLGSLLLAVALSAAPQTTFALDTNSRALIGRAEHEAMELSPDGKYIAVARHEEGGSFVLVLNSADRTLFKSLNLGPGADILSMTWLGSDKLVVGMNRLRGDAGVSVQEPWLYLFRMNTTHPVTFPDNFIGTIDNDDEHILVSSCEHKDAHGCIYEAALLDVNDLREGSRKRVALAPVEDASFSADHSGAIRFAWAEDDKDQSKLYVTDNGTDWKPLNDESVSNIDIFPVGISRDNRSAYLQVQHRDGPDSIERYDFATGTRTLLLRDTVSDPLSIIYSMDRREPIGAMFGPGRPQARFWDPASMDARWRMAINKAFPDSMCGVKSASTDGNLVIVSTENDRDPGAFYLLDVVHHKADLLARRYPAVDPKKGLPSEPFEMKARDGLTLYGFVTRPAGGSGPVPTVVMVHGGPYTIRDDWAFDPEVQLLAQHGYAVVRVNFRGSGGFGLPFKERGYMQWGAAMQDDVTDATHWAIEQGIADPKRICIYGGSYGGYAALMGVVREPKLYRCAVGLAGVYDLSKQYLWGDTHRSDLGISYLHRVLGSDKAELDSRSPSKHAADIKVPVLLAHGGLDGRVPIYHAEEMRSALTSAGSAPEYLRYNDEGHGLIDTNHRIDFYTHLLGFLDANLDMKTADTSPAASGANQQASASTSTNVH
ncbi:alpha/beta hydrolase family protein [Dyella nitratireducens]|uniref:Peptidase S9 n=1 Tax=Dyella nitratireducens TaxID=1849580 RepID=A0ABQ1FIJ9_9GAMM|nr:alpha/beta fold hydrolase [Dyella nitratireducens]GGA16930.1 peptidase S9 [Dyella nitratireducens]GLQ44858.1 peptidase S9 [Dyella nitratireducens]